MERLFLLSDLVCAIAQATNANSANSTMVFMSADDVVDQPEKNSLLVQAEDIPVKHHPFIHEHTH